MKIENGRKWSLKWESPEQVAINLSEFRTDGHSFFTMGCSSLYTTHFKFDLRRKVCDSSLLGIYVFGWPFFTSRVMCSDSKRGGVSFFYIPRPSKWVPKLSGLSVREKQFCDLIYGCHVYRQVGKGTRRRCWAKGNENERQMEWANLFIVHFSGIFDSITTIASQSQLDVPLQSVPSRSTSQSI